MIEIPFQNRSSISQLDETEKEDEQKELTPRNTFLREMFKIMIEGIGLSIVSGYAMYCLLRFINSSGSVLLLIVAQTTSSPLTILVWSTVAGGGGGESDRGPPQNSQFLRWTLGKINCPPLL